MTDTGRPVSQEDLHAYVDERLEPARRLEVEGYLEGHPEIAETIAADIEVRQGLRAAMGARIADPLPPELDVTRLIEQRLQRRRSAWRIAAMVALALGAGAGAGWTLHAPAPPPSRPELAVSLLKQQTIASYAVYAADQRHPIEVSGDQTAHLTAWLSRRLDRDVTIPDLSAAGYHLMGGRLLATEKGNAAALLMYENAEGDRVALVLRPMAPDLAAKQTDVSNGRINGCVWIADGMGYGVVGTVPDEKLDQVSGAIHSQLKG